MPGKPKVDSPWTEERIEQLHLLLLEHLSASQIAARIGVTRNAIIGKCHRLGLILGRINGNSPPKPKKEKQSREKRSRHKPGYAWVKNPKTGCHSFKLVQLPTLPAPAPRKRRAKHYKQDLMKLSRDMCKWPLWEFDTPFEEQYYCADTCREGHSYCEYHYDIAYRGARRDPSSVFVIRR